MQMKRTMPTTAAAAEPPHHHGYKCGKRNEGMAGMARAYQYAHFFLIFFVSSHIVTAQTVRRDSLLPLNYSITDCVHSLQRGEVARGHWHLKKICGVDIFFKATLA